jgi:ribose/xylose/arabinose/galactoside ABC-type transport system permease subunit
LFNALLIASKTAPLLVTLGSMTLFAGAATAISRGEAILLDEPTWLSTKPLGVSAGFWILAMVAAAGIWLVRFHRIGRYLIAVGENERAAVRAGAPVTATVVAAYGLTGLLAGVAAILLTERGRSVIPIPEPGLELRVIACVILGGTRVTGGFGGVERTLVGLLILAGVEQSLGLLGSIRYKLPWSDQTTYLPQDWRYILIGVIVIVTGCLNERLIGRRRRD